MYHWERKKNKTKHNKHFSLDKRKIYNVERWKIMKNVIKYKNVAISVLFKPLYKSYKKSQSTIKI